MQSKTLRIELDSLPANIRNALRTFLIGHFSEVTQEDVLEVAYTAIVLEGIEPVTKFQQFSGNEPLFVSTKTPGLGHYHEADATGVPDEPVSFNEDGRPELPDEDWDPQF